jgi:peptide/nickel transport system substrate-binding protein
MNRQFGGLLLAGLVFVAGCGGADPTAGPGAAEVDQNPVEGDWLVVAYDAEADNLNRIISNNAYSGYIMEGSMGSMVAEYLLGYNPETWRVDVPLLAESYPVISEDNLTYTFMTREGVQWHDGEPFSAEDVLFSVKAMMNPFADSASQRGYYSDLADVQVEGRQVRFVVSKPYWLNDIALSTLVIVAKHVYDPDGVLDNYSFADIVAPAARDDATLREFGAEFNENPANRSPIGTGPFKFESWESGSEIVLVRNDDYWGEKAYLEKILIKFVTDATARLTALKAGEIDFDSRLTPIQYAQQTSGANFESDFDKAAFNIPQLSYIVWNSQRPFFADKRVRQAMTMLIPRQQIIDSLRFGLAELATSPFNPSSPDFNPNIEAFPHDPARAAALLDEAGWIDHDGDGIRDKDGVKFSFEFLGSVGSSFTDQLLPIIKEEFGKVGIEMTERRLEFTVVIENVRDLQYDAYAGAWLSDLFQDPHQLWHSSSIGNRGSNFGSFDNAEADRLMEAARQEFDPEKRKQLYWEFQDILHEEQPYTFMLYPQESVAFHQRFQQVDFLPVRPGYDLTQWFVPLVSQRYTPVSPQ